MLSDHLCDGTFSLNGTILATTLGVGTQDSFLTVGALDRRYYLTLDYFTPAVFSRGDDQTMFDGACYLLKGPMVASLNHGPLGHPGDGEYDRWEFSEIAFAFRFTRNTLSVTLEGTSELGLSGAEIQQSLPKQSTQVAFTVLRPRMKEFLRATDSGWSYFEKRLDGLP